MDESAFQPSIGIINFGVGNVGSVQRFFARLGHAAEILDPRSDWSGSEIVVVPGVGSFDGLMERIQAAGCKGKLIDVIKNDDQTYIGICLGFQILANSSDEGSEGGLEVIDATVRSFRELECDIFVPHMGWNHVRFDSASFSDEYFYFVHSYYLDENVSAAFGMTEYAVPVCATVRMPGVWGIQFHPEKSGSNGLRFGSQLLHAIQKEKNPGSANIQSKTGQDNAISAP